VAVKTLSQLGVLYTERRDFYISPNEVRELWTSITPFTTIVSNRGIEKVGDPDFKLFEHRAGWIKQEFVHNGSTAWASAGAPGDTAANTPVDGIVGLASTVDTSYIGLLVEIYAQDRVTYKGNAYIYNVGGSAGQLNIKSMGNPRAASQACSALADNDVFVVYGNAFGEGTKAPDGYTDDLEVVYNSTEIFKTSVEITGTLYEAALRGYSSELARLRIDKNKEHKMQKERSYLFGVRIGGTGVTDLAADNANADGHRGSGSHTTDKDGNLLRTTMGIIPTIYRYGTADTTNDKQNIFTINAGTYVYSNFVDDMEKVFQYLPEDGTKVALCGAGALSYWSKVDSVTGFVKKSGFSVQHDSMQRSELGFNFKNLITPHGQLQLVYAPALRGPYRNTMLVIDPADLKYKMYRAPRFKANVKTDDDYDGVKDVFFSDEGIGMTLIEKHSLFNIVGA
jgi:hypothetical protein